MKIHRTMLLVCMTGLCLAGARTASATVATASLDWSNLEVFALGLPNQTTPTISLSQQSTAWSTNASTINDSNDSHSHNAFNWTSALDVSSVTPRATGEAFASSSVISTNASALQSTGSDPSLLNQSTASLTRQALVTVSGPSAVIFSVPYSMSVDDQPFDPFNRTMAGVSGSASFNPFNGTAFDSTSRSFNLDSAFQGPSTQNGTLFFGLVVDGAGTINVGFSAFTSATAPDPVPEPATVWSLLAGVAATGFMFRRRAMSR